MEKLVQVVKYAVFLQHAAHMGLTWAEVRKRVIDCKKGDTASAPSVMRLVQDVLDKGVDSDIALSKQVLKIWNEVVHTFPVITEGEDKVIRCNDLLLRPLVQTANEYVFSKCRQKGWCLTVCREYGDDEDIQIYPLFWSRRGMTNAVVGIVEGKNEGEEYVLRFVDLKEDVLLLETKIPIDSTVKKQFSDALLLELLDQSFSRQMMGEGNSCETVILSKSELALAKKYLSALHTETLYKIGILQKEGADRQKHLDWAEADADARGILNFYYRSLSVEGWNTGTLRGWIHYIPSRIYRGKNTDRQLLFDMSLNRTDEELEILLSHCTMPLDKMQYAIADDVAESHLRKRSGTTGYIIEDHFLKEIYLRQTQVVSEEQTYILRDAQIASGFLEASVNDEGALCIYWNKRCKEK